MMALETTFGTLAACLAKTQHRGRSEGEEEEGARIACSSNAAQCSAARRRAEAIGTRPADVASTCCTTRQSFDRRGQKWWWFAPSAAHSDLSCSCAGRRQIWMCAGCRLSRGTPVPSGSSLDSSTGLPRDETVPCLGVSRGKGLHGGDC